MSGASPGGQITLQLKLPGVILGVGLGAIMVYHQSIWPAVFAHGIFDATTFALLPLALKHGQHFN